MKKTKLLTSLAALALVLSLGACETKDVETTSSDDTTTSEDTSTEETTSDVTIAENFLLDIDYYSVNWEALGYTYEWANLTDYEGEAMTRDLQLTEKNFYPYGSQTEIWYDVLQNEPTHPQESVFYYADGYGFEPDTGIAWTYGDTYDDALDYYLTDIDLQIAWEYSEGIDYLSAVEVEYTDDVVTGATFYHHAETEGVGVVDDYFTYRTDTNHVLTQYIYETLTTVDQEYGGEDVHLVIYAKHNLRLVDPSTIYVPDFNPDDYNIEGVEPGYDTELPEIGDFGEVVSEDTLTRDAAEAIVTATNIEQINSWTGLAYGNQSLTEGGITTLEYYSTLNGSLYGFKEQYLGLAELGVLTTGLFYKDGYSYEYAPTSSGESEYIGSGVSSSEKLSDKLGELVYNINSYQNAYYYQERDNGEYFSCTKAVKTTYDTGYYSLEIDYILNFDNDSWEQIDHTEYDYTYYYDASENLVGFYYNNPVVNNYGSNGEPSYNNPTETTGFTVTLYEITADQVTAVLPEWTANF